MLAIVSIRTGAIEDVVWKRSNMLDVEIAEAVIRLIRSGDLGLHTWRMEAVIRGAELTFEIYDRIQCRVNERLAFNPIKQ